MKPELILTNTRVVTKEKAFDGTVVVRDGVIAAVDEKRSWVPSAFDLNGGDLLPGLIEMHTDNMERHFQPRPGVLWPNPVAAVVAHDLQIAGAGITTVYDAVSVGEYDTKGFRREILSQSVEAIRRAQDTGILRAEHMLHLRCEISDAAVIAMFEPVVDNPLVQLVSLMDHTPGQRQWQDLAKFAQFNKAKQWSAGDLDEVVRRRREGQVLYAEKHRRTIVEMCRARALPLASHDDATDGHVMEAVEDNCVISEFPVTVEAARLACSMGLGTILGAPNVVRGGSHSGNVSALDLAREGVLSGLSSDYVPSSLLQAIFVLEQQTPMTLPDAVACASANVAAMVGLADRGAIEPGLRADLIHVHHAGRAPVVRNVWRGGERVI